MAEPILKNYVVIRPGETRRMRLTEPVLEEVVIPDPATKLPKTIRRLRWKVVELDGTPTVTYFNVVSEKLAQILMALWGRRVGDTICVEITRIGSGLVTDWQVRPC